MNRTRRHKRWQSWETDYLKKNYGNTGVNRMANDLSRTRASIAAMANKMGLGVQRGTRPMTKEAITFKNRSGLVILRRNWTSEEETAFKGDILSGMSRAKLVLKYKRGFKAIWSKATRLGIGNKIAPSAGEDYQTGSSLTGFKAMAADPISRLRVSGGSFCIVDPDKRELYADYGMYDTIEKLSEALDDTDKQLLREGQLKVYHATEMPVKVGFIIREA